MLIHYCVIAFKNIWKYKVSASISILGLAFALVCFVPILYWMDHETTYEPPPRLCFQPKTAEPKRLLISK